MPKPIGRSRVNKIYPVLKRRADGLERLLFIGSTPHEAPNRPRPQADARSLAVQAAHCHMFHGIPTSEISASTQGFSL